MGSLTLSKITITSTLQCWCIYTVMLLSDLALHIPKLVPRKVCEEFSKEWQRRRVASRTESYKAIDGKMLDDNYRVVALQEGTEIYNKAVGYQQQALSEWLDHLDSFEAFHINVLRDQLLYPHSVRILKYGEGQSISPHTDWNHFTHASVTLNLNEDYEGGEFEFFRGRMSYRLAQGDALIFPADCFWVHAVKPITRGARFSVNSFIRSLNNEKRDRIIADIDNWRKDLPPLYKF